MTKKILFVDDEPSIRAIYEMLPGVLGAEYSVTTASSPEEAISCVTSEIFDVVVTDLRMPRMSGAELLGKVAQLSPTTARVVVSGFADELTIAKCLLAGHRYFTKPFNPIDLTDWIRSLDVARASVSSDSIRKLVGRMESLPTPSDTYMKIMKVLNNANTPLHEIAFILEQDPSLSAKVLQAVNSAMFGSSRRIVSLLEALQLIGLQVLRALVLTIQVFDFYQNPWLKSELQRIWMHSSRVAQRARRYAQDKAWDDETCDEAFFSALLHDIGRVVLLASPKEERESLFPKYVCGHDDSSAQYALSHTIEAEAGSYLLSLWGIPEPIVIAVKTFRSAIVGPTAPASAATALAVAHEVELRSEQKQS